MIVSQCSGSLTSGLVPRCWSISDVSMFTHARVFRGEGQLKQAACTEEQIPEAVRPGEAGTPVAEVCRTLGGSEQPFSRWQRPCAGMGVAERRRRRPWAEENRQRQPLVAALTLAPPRLPEGLRQTF